MSEALIGTVIGGAIALVASVITQIFVYKRWKKERRLEHLRSKRERLAKMFSELTRQLTKTLNEGSISFEMGATFELLAPPKVAEDFLRWIEEEPETAEEKQVHFLRIMRSMKRELASLDSDIEKCL